MMSILFDNSMSGGSVPTWKTLLIGESLSDAKAEKNKPYLITSSDAADDIFGVKSMLSEMIKAYKKNDQNIETWAIALEDDGDIDNVFTAIKDTRFNAFVNPFCDEKNLKKFSDKLQERWEPTLQNDGFAFCFSNKSVEESIAFSAKLNSQNICLIDTYGIENHPHEIISAVAAQCSASALNDPALPLSTLALSGIIAPQPFMMRTFAERSILLGAGISTLNAVGNNVCIERIVTTYKQNNSGINDESYLNAETIFTLSRIREYVRTRFWSKYCRFKLADSGAFVAQGQKILTPKIANAEMLCIFRELEELGLVQDADIFIKNLVIERDKQNRSQLNMLLPYTVMSQLFQVNANIQFRR